VRPTNSFSNDALESTSDSKNPKSITFDLIFFSFFDFCFNVFDFSCFFINLFDDPILFLSDLLDNSDK
jgi:hypothetical protein